MFSFLFDKKQYDLVCVSEVPAITSSKFGGLPYCKSGEEVPVDEDGKKMQLLVQINFDEVKVPLSFGPKHGMLQFFISTKGSAYGTDFSNLLNKNGFRVIYHEVVDYSVTEAKVLSYDLPEGHGNSSTPVQTSCKIELVSVKQKDNKGSHIFGSPRFCQDDPRPLKPEYSSSKYDTLLLQIDSCATDNHVEFGDQGIAQFFINQKALKNLDFSDILYNWDCC